MVTHELLAVELATMDDLTRLSNRRGFEVLAQKILRVCQRQNKSATLLYYDLDEFKSINDRFGHAEGDFALARFAEFLTSTFRDSDILGRLGGDEFGVLIADANDDGIRNAQQRLSTTIDHYNQTTARGYSLQYSVGIAALTPSEKTDIGELMTIADRSMYQQKSHKESSD